MIEGLVDHIRSLDVAEATRALNIIKMNTMLLPNSTKERKKIFDLLLDRVGDEQSQVRKETLILLSEMKDLWIDNTQLLRKFNQKLRVWKENPLLSEIAKGLLIQPK